MKVKHYKHINSILNATKKCSSYNHKYQYTYSIEENEMIQVCFTCNTLRTNIPKDNPSIAAYGKYI